jgi:hypothetical protein
MRPILRTVYFLVRIQWRPLGRQASLVVEDKPGHSLTTIAIHKKRGEESLNRFKVSSHP